MMAAPLRRIGSVDDLVGRRALVLGLARSGLAAARFLTDAGALVTAYDRRPASELAAEIAGLGARQVSLALGVAEHDALALLGSADLLVTSPSVSARFPTTDEWLRTALRDAERRGAEIVSEVELFLRLTRARILAVTGTKGKTTTSALTAAILERAGISHVLGGNIGTPLVERSLELGRDDWAVLELSELQLPTVSRGADVAVYTNIGADHLDRHGTVAAYRAVKARLAELSAAEGRIVLNADDGPSRELGASLGDARISWYGLDSTNAPDGAPLDATVDAGGWVTVQGERSVRAADVRLPGRHLLADALAASLGASLAGASPELIGEAVAGFRGVPHRLELVAETDGVRWVNDSQATIPMAAIAALEAFDAPVVLIAGGKDKGLEYGAFADAIAARARAAVLIGETATVIERELRDRVPVRRAASMDEAVAAAAAVARAGDVVLLSPAAASFDMFEDYAARGDAFRAAAASRGEGA